MSEHYKYAPSAAYIWEHCGGSTTIDVNDVDDDDQYSGRGSLLHDCAHQMLTGGQGSYNVTAAQKRTRTEWYTFEPDDAEAVANYVAYCQSLPGYHFHEKRTQWIEDCGGTTDFATVTPELLHIVDFKAGFVKRSPEQNPQLGIYALGMARLLRGIFDFKRVRMTIYQPMHLDDPMDPPSWEVPIAELNRMGKRLAARVRALKKGTPSAITFKPRTDRCRFCTVASAGKCPALGAETIKAAHADFAGYEKDKPVPEYAGKALADMTPLERYEMAGLVELWAKKEKERVTSGVKMGTHVDGFKLVAGNKKRSVTDRGGLVEHLVKQGFGEDVIYVGEPVLVSPAQAENLFTGTGCGVKKKALSPFFSEEPGAPVVVPEYDHRPSVDPVDSARQDFADYQRKEEE